MDKHELLQNMLMPYEQQLYQLNQPNADRSEVCYSPGKDEKYGTYDKNFTTRFRILTAIQFQSDPLPYESLILLMLEEEIKDRESNSFQGCGNLELITWLVKKIGTPNLDKQFKRAKEANFDTHCGFDYESIGRNYFQDDVSALDTEECFLLAIDLGVPEYQDMFIDLWKSEQNEWNADVLKKLKLFEKLRKNMAGELAAAQQLFDLQKDGLSEWDTCSGLQTIMNLHLQLDDTENAYRILTEILTHLDNIEWRHIGLGRFIMENCMDLLIAAPEYRDHLWVWALPNILKMQDSMHGNLYSKAARAAELFGETDLAAMLICKHKELLNY